MSTPEPTMSQFATKEDYWKARAEQAEQQRDELKEKIAASEAAVSRYVETLNATCRERDELLAALKDAVSTIEWVKGCTAPADDEVEKAIREGNKTIAKAEGQK